MAMLNDKCAEVAEIVSNELENGTFTFSDWNDLGEVIIHHEKRVFRLTVEDVTDELD